MGHQRTVSFFEDITKKNATQPDGIIRYKVMSKSFLTLESLFPFNTYLWSTGSNTKSIEVTPRHLLVAGDR